MNEDNTFECPQCGNFVDHLIRVEIHKHEIRIIPISSTVIDNVADYDYGAMKKPFYKCPVCKNVIGDSEDDIWDLIRISEIEK